MQHDEEDEGEGIELTEALSRIVDEKKYSDVEAIQSITGYETECVPAKILKQNEFTFHFHRIGEFSVTKFANGFLLFYKGKRDPKEPLFAVNTETFVLSYEPESLAFNCLVKVTATEYHTKYGFIFETTLDKLSMNFEVVYGTFTNRTIQFIKRLVGPTEKSISFRLFGRKFKFGS